jgi:hypothetical protein
MHPDHGMHGTHSDPGKHIGSLANGKPDTVGSQHNNLKLPSNSHPSTPAPSHSPAPHIKGKGK